MGKDIESIVCLISVFGAHVRFIEAGCKDVDVAGGMGTVLLPQLLGVMTAWDG